MEIGGKQIPVTDDHIHLDPAGFGVEAIKEFHRAGGTHIILVHKPYHDCPVQSGSDYHDSFKITMDLAEQVREHTPVKVQVALGPYPVELVHLQEKMPVAQAKDILLEGMGIARDLIQEGKALCFGEIGFPHFPVAEEIQTASEEVFSQGLKYAKEIDCAVMFHGPRTSSELCFRLRTLADAASFPAQRLVKHYSIPPSPTIDMNGLTPSILSKGEWIRETLEITRDFMIETDYIDDRERPGAVLGPKTVPRKTLQLFNDGSLDEELIYHIHQDMPEKIYGGDFHL